MLLQNVGTFSNPELHMISCVSQGIKKCKRAAYFSLYRWIIPSVVSTLGLPQKNFTAADGLDHDLPLPGLALSTFFPCPQLSSEYVTGFSNSDSRSEVCMSRS